MTMNHAALQDALRILHDKMPKADVHVDGSPPSQVLVERFDTADGPQQRIHVISHQYRYGTITKLANGDLVWTVYGHEVLLAVSEATNTVEEQDEEDPTMFISTQYVPVYLDGEKAFDAHWAVAQEGLNDLLQSVQMSIEDKVAPGTLR